MNAIAMRLEVSFQPGDPCVVAAQRIVLADKDVVATDQDVSLEACATLYVTSPAAGSAALIKAVCTDGDSTSVQVKTASMHKKVSQLKGTEIWLQIFSTDIRVHAVRIGYK